MIIDTTLLQTNSMNNPIDYVNNVELTGRVGTYPKEFELRSGSTLTKIGLVVKAPYSNNEEPTWVNVQFWDELALKANEHIEIGSQINIEAELEISSWNDKNTGSRRSAPVLNAKTFEILSQPEIGVEVDSEFLIEGIAESEEEIFNNEFW